MGWVGLGLDWVWVGRVLVLVVVVVIVVALKTIAVSLSTQFLHVFVLIQHTMGPIILYSRCRKANSRKKGMLCCSVVFGRVFVGVSDRVFSLVRRGRPAGWLANQKRRRFFSGVMNTQQESRL